MTKEIKKNYFLKTAKINQEMEEIIDYILGENPNQFTMEIAVAFEEAFVNIIKYAYEKGGGPVSIEITKDVSKIKIILKDNGKYYDPTKTEVKKITDEFQVGGQGILIMTSFSDVSYQRENNCNILTLVKTN